MSILSDQKTRENFGLQAHHKFLTEFTAEKMCQRTINLYRSLLVE
jgi:glycosyltransferase involved in cell wall biosynthesis